ncbi:MAG: aminopeptidase N, partial [Rhodobiaceae bacterium]|nr:aminopeptidase N [Rhodobiaceae bacterium]
MRTDTPQPIFLKDYRPPAYLIDRVDLSVRLDPTESEIRAVLDIRPNGDPAAPSGPLVLDGEDLKLVSIALDGITLTEKAYILGNDTLTLNAVPKGPFTLEIVNTVNPTANTRLMGLYRTSGTYCTQCEAEGFRRITYFLDRPDVLAVYTVRLEAAKAEAPVLLANGNPMDSGDIPGTDRHYAVWHDPYPKPSYLFAMVGGDLARVSDRFATASGRAVDLNIFVEHGKADSCAYAMDALKRSMKWDEDAFGREYDLDVFNIVAVS